MTSHLEISTCSTLQREEWEVLEAIYPDCVSSDISKGIRKLEIPIEFGDSRPVYVVDDSTFKTEDALVTRRDSRSLSLSSLPPVLLDLLLPPSYPLSSAPIILSMHASLSWLPRISTLQQKMIEMWQPGESILYNWVEWIRSGEFLHSLDLVILDSGREAIRIFHPSPHLLAPLLTNHDAMSKSSIFSQNSYECSICLTYQKGARCLRLLCGHIFCRNCLEDGWKLYIAEGDVARVGCLDPTCVKEGREANEEEVRRVVTEEEVRRWKWLREKRLLDQDPTIIHCPMALCQTPVPKPKTAGEANPDSGWDRLRTCQACGYSFCAFCKRTWHGPLADCPIPIAESFLLEYMALPADSAARRVFEQRYGLRNLTRMVAKCEEERANREWLAKSTMACPQCDVHVEKSTGCNHMTCGKCKTHFCYLCGRRLNATNPYEHFSTPGARCYMKLFDGHETEGWEPMGDEWVEDM